jgi:NADPH:quinone reductase-like Zn-dependent oxidoreductase
MSYADVARSDVSHRRRWGGSFTECHRRGIYEADNEGSRYSRIRQSRRLKVRGRAATADELTEIGKLIDERKIRVIVSQTFPLSEAGQAQEQVATGHTRGKIVLKVADEPK